jgi:hypothetical protein
MALTAQNTLDIVNQTQTVSFYEGANLVDQIVYSSNSITFENISSYNLSKSDALLYFQYLNAFFNLLSINFPIINASATGKWPLSTFSITETDVGVLKVDYNQTSNGTNVMSINYVPIAGAAAFGARAAPINITMQEFFMTLNLMTQFTNQVSQN